MRKRREFAQLTDFKGTVFQDCRLYQVRCGDQVSGDSLAVKDTFLDDGRILSEVNKCMLVLEPVEINEVDLTDSCRIVKRHTLEFLEKQCLFSVDRVSEPRNTAKFGCSDTSTTDNMEVSTAPSQLPQKPQPIKLQ